MTARKELVKINCERCRRMPVRPPPLFTQSGGARLSWVLLHKAPQPPGRVRSLVQTLGTTQSVQHRVHTVCRAFFSTWLKFS